MSQPSSAPDRSRERRLMVDGQIRTFGVTDLDLIDQFLAVPREYFVDAGQAGLAYSDAPMRLAGDPPRHLVAPMVLARMIQAAQIRTGDRVLDLAGGMGYGAAILGGLGCQVTMVEQGGARVESARKLLRAERYGKINVNEGPIVGGWLAAAPYDVIVLEGAYGAPIDPLLQQLADGGRCVAIRRVADGAVGQVMLHVATRGAVGARPILDARAAWVEGFEPAPAFVF